MFIISLSYGMRNLRTNDPEQYQEKMDIDRKYIEEALRKEYDSKYKLELQKLTSVKLKDSLKEKINELQEKQKEIEKERFMLKGKEDEIRRLESMNSTVSTMSTALKLVVFRAKVKQLDIMEYYYDDKGEKITIDKIDRPSGKNFQRYMLFKDTDRIYNQYYGIVDQEFTIDGGVDLNRIRIWETNDIICFSGITLGTPERIEPKNRRLLSQLRKVKFRKDAADPTIESLVSDPYSKGALYQEDEIKNKSKYEFDDTTKEFIAKSAENFIKLFLAPFGKKVVYAPTMIEEKETFFLPVYFKNKIQKIKQEEDTTKIQLIKLETEYSEEMKSLDSSVSDN